MGHSLLFVQDQQQPFSFLQSPLLAARTLVVTYSVSSSKFLISVPYLRLLRIVVFHFSGVGMAHFGQALNCMPMASYVSLLSIPIQFSRPPTSSTWPQSSSSTNRENGSPSSVSKKSSSTKAFSHQQHLVGHFLATEPNAWMATKECPLTGCITTRTMSSSFWISFILSAACSYCCSQCRFLVWNVLTTTSIWEMTGIAYKAFFKAVPSPASLAS